MLLLLQSCSFSVVLLSFVVVCVFSSLFVAVAAFYALNCCLFVIVLLLLFIFLKIISMFDECVKLVFQSSQGKIISMFDECVKLIFQSSQGKKVFVTFFFFLISF